MLPAPGRRQQTIAPRRCSAIQAFRDIGVTLEARGRLGQVAIGRGRRPLNHAVTIDPTLLGNF